MPTGIEWTDETWTVVTGCSKVSPGCANCYAETLSLTRLTGKPGYTDLPWTPTNAARNVALRDDRMDQPLRWKEPRRVFVTSMGDLFHELVSDAFLDEVFAVMALCDGTRSNGRHHTFQVLTKRPERARAYLTDPDTPWRVAAAICNRTVGFRPHIGELQDPNPWETSMGEHHRNQWGARGLDTWSEPWPLRNVWIGTSVENQMWADRRIPELLATPAAVRFLSCEPLLGPVDLVHPVGAWLMERTTGLKVPPGDRVRFFDGAWPLHWVIAGGESGPDHRPLELDHARSLRDQCVSAGVPFLFKQVGGRTPKAGGRDLDGRTWDEFPAVRA